MGSFIHLLVLSCIATIFNVNTATPVDSNNALLSTMPRESHWTRENSPTLQWEAPELKTLGFGSRLQQGHLLRRSKRDRRRRPQNKPKDKPISIQGGDAPFCNNFGCNCTPPPKKRCCNGYQFDPRSKKCKKVNG